MRTPLFVFRLKKAVRRAGAARLALSLACLAGVAAVLLLAGVDEDPGDANDIVKGGAWTQTGIEPPPAARAPEKREERMQAAAVAEPRRSVGADLGGTAPFDVAPLRSIDGTSFRHGDAVVHLAGVEGPGAGDVCRDGALRWSCGLQARAALHNLVAGRSLTCQPRKALGDGVLSADCRLPARGSLPSGDVAGLLVLQGWARPEAGAGDRFGEGLAQARRERAGLWRGDWTIVAAER